MQWLKQSTAVTVKIGPFLDESDGKTAETGLTIAQADVRLSKNGGNIAQKNESSACTHDELGIYGCPLDATDTNTLGRLQLFVHESGALPVWHDFLVVPAVTYDSLVSGSDYLTVDAVQVEGGDATDAINAAVDTALDTAIPGSPTADSINQRIKAIDELTEASGDGDLAAILADTNELQGDLTDAGRLDALIDAIKAITDDWADGERLDLLLDAIKAKTDNLPADPADDSDIDSQLSTIDTVVDAIKAVTDNLPNSGALTDLATAAALAVVDTVVDAIKAVTDALNDPTAAAIADQVWDEAKSGHTASGSFGEEVQAHALSSEVSGLNDPSAAAIADAVWDETLADHDSDGTTGEKLNDTDTLGTGGTTVTLTILDGNSDPIADVKVWVTTSNDIDDNIIASGETNDSGVVTFYLDAGTYYVWKSKAGYTFTNPETKTVS